MDVTFSTFLGQLVSNPVLAVTVILALGAIFVNGWTDAPNAIATCVTTRCMPARAAILMSAAFNFLGVLIMTHFNASVANTISHIVDFGGNSTMALACLCAALFSIVVYGATASRFGIPTSQSHSLIAGLTGAAIALGGASSVNVHEWMKVIYGLALSIGLGFVMGWVLCKLVSILFAAANRRRANVFFKYAQIASAAAMSFMHGAQDGQKFIGVLFLGVAFANGQTISSLRMILPRRAIVRTEIKTWFSELVKDETVVMYHNLPSLSLHFIRSGIGDALLCVEGSYGIRPTPGLRFVRSGTSGAPQVRAAQEPSAFQSRRNLLVSVAKSRPLISCNLCMKNH